MTIIILWHQEVCGIIRDKVNDDANENDAANNKINNNKTSKSFEYKKKILGRTPDDNNTLNTEVVVPLKYLTNFSTSLDLLLINFEIELALSWPKNCIISEISITLRIPANPDDNPPI